MKNVSSWTPEVQIPVTAPVQGFDGLKVVIAWIINNADEAASTSTSCS